MDELLDILKEINADVDYEKETKLIDNGIFNSFDIVSLVAKLNETFDIEIGAGDITAANFNSAKSIMHLVDSLRE